MAGWAQERSGATTSACGSREVESSGQGGHRRTGQGAVCSGGLQSRVWDSVGATTTHVIPRSLFFLSFTTPPLTAVTCCTMSVMYSCRTAPPSGSSATPSSMSSKRDSVLRATWGGEGGGWKAFTTQIHHVGKRATCTRRGLCRGATSAAPLQHRTEQPQAPLGATCPAQQDGQKGAASMAENRLRPQRQHHPTRPPHTTHLQAAADLLRWLLRAEQVVGQTLGVR